MVTNKDLKRVVRARMEKTGESYTAARANLLKKPKARAAAKPAAEPVAPAAPDYAGLAGMSDATIQARTGCSWEKWVYVLDKAGAHQWEHKEIAEYVNRKYKTGDWWTQSVTVGYERIKGLRDKGQRRGGSYEASKSKTFTVPVSRLFQAWHDARLRKKWLPETGLTIRTAQPNRSLRITWPDGTSVECWFTAKGDAKSSVQVAHTKLPSQEAVKERKAYWAERLEALAAVLEGRSKK